jgi:hypothetical protein
MQTLVAVFSRRRRNPAPIPWTDRPSPEIETMLRENCLAAVLDKIHDIAVLS